MKIIGIDPGLSGAIAILDNNQVINIFDMPVMSEGKKNKRQLNSAQLVKLLKDNILKNEEISVVVEKFSVNLLATSINEKIIPYVKRTIIKIINTLVFLDCSEFVATIAINDIITITIVK